jgi:hypothetical protein
LPCIFVFWISGNPERVPGQTGWPDRFISRDLSYYMGVLWILVSNIFGPMQNDFPRNTHDLIFSVLAGSRRRERREKNGAKLFSNLSMSKFFFPGFKDFYSFDFFIAPFFVRQKERFYWISKNVRIKVPLKNFLGVINFLTLNYFLDFFFSPSSFFLNQNYGVLGQMKSSQLKIYIARCIELQ